MLDVKTDETSISIIAPYKEAVVYVKEFYHDLIEKAIKQYLNKELPISYECIEVEVNETEKRKGIFN